MHFYVKTMVATLPAAAQYFIAAIQKIIVFMFAKVAQSNDVRTMNKPRMSKYLLFAKKILESQDK